MHIFITGSTGYIGRALTSHLLASGHTILALVRPHQEATNPPPSNPNITLLPGTLTDLATLTHGATTTDATIHLAFSMSFTSFAESCAIDLSAISTLGAALLGTDKPLVVTSGTLNLAGRGVGLESMRAEPGPVPRYLAEWKVEELAKEGVRAMVVRLPPSVHGEEDVGMMPKFIAVGAAKKEVAYVGDGGQRWPSVHREDAAMVYMLAVERGVKGGMYHAVGDEGVSIREIAEVVAGRLGVGMRCIAGEEAAGWYGFMGPLLGVDNPCESKRTREELGWVPKGCGLLEDLREGEYYFAEENIGRVVEGL
ncbi:NAD(P)-binding Rossmann-fold containing protein [Glarea lozoyensis ATCC 20868]|uniref:NAD(P)-binding Rossmann-fold containing protein n=1 Tax=Glarea lozoyensis (strain ATCC 20868 / MF5171) TaxID=1116229 RepID=S3DEU8_GLAL2|nr:NAD(P)-binding Rossmann-fold containing protein [Glarea lozoyensis ATCC 20868]EPE30511.1 NAD(P)-binding Rossmann-fold containing protein [Glarea lozoyensis ATCC 20868]